MDSFKYALSGEFAFQQDILHDIPFPRTGDLRWACSKFIEISPPIKFVSVDIS